MFYITPICPFFILPTALKVLGAALRISAGVPEGHSAAVMGPQRCLYSLPHTLRGPEARRAAQGPPRHGSSEAGSTTSPPSLHLSLRGDWQGSGQAVAELLAWEPCTLGSSNWPTQTPSLCLGQLLVSPLGEPAPLRCIWGPPPGLCGHQGHNPQSGPGHMAPPPPGWFICNKVDLLLPFICPI